jgi:hypothetical protein
MIPTPNRRPWVARRQHKLDLAGPAYFLHNFSFVIDSNRYPDYQSHMPNLNDLTTEQIRRIVSIKQQIEALQGQIDSIAAGADGEVTPDSVTPTVRKKHRMSRAGRAAIAAAARARWARIKGTAPKKSKPAKKLDRRSSPAVRAKLAAAARARWARAKKAGKTTL